MGKSDTSKKALSNMAWRFAERSGAQLVSLIVSIVIARILDPEAYGVVAIVTVFNTILFVFIDSGLGNALIQKKNSDDVDFSTVFYTNIALCMVLYLGLFFAAPFVADYYGNPDMISLLRVSGLTLLISSVKNVQQAYVSKKLIFKKFFLATLGGTVGAAIVGIWMAKAGYGAWALVVSGLFNNTVDTIVLWFTVKWRPKRVFSFERLKGLFSYGSKILFANIVQTFYSNMYDLIIGKVYTTSDLAFFNKGKQLPNLAVKNVDDSINSVLLPLMSEKQDNISSVKAMTKRALKMNMYIMAPVLLGLAAVAEPLIRVLLAEKWVPCVIYLQLFATMQVFRPITTANLNAIKALGRSDIFLKLEVIKDILGVVIILFSVNKGVSAIALGVFIHAGLCAVINAFPSKKVLNYGLGEQIMDILPIMSLAIFMAMLVYAISFANLYSIVTLILQVSAGVLIYVALSVLFKVESFDYTIGLIKRYKGGE